MVVYAVTAKLGVSWCQFFLTASASVFVLTNTKYWYQVLTELEHYSLTLKTQLFYLAQGDSSSS